MTPFLQHYVVVNLHTFGSLIKKKYFSSLGISFKRLDKVDTVR